MSIKVLAGLAPPTGFGPPKDGAFDARSDGMLVGGIGLTRSSVLRGMVEGAPGGCTGIAAG